jgi:hypothetical protein
MEGNLWNMYRSLRDEVKIETQEFTTGLMEWLEW